MNRWQQLALKVLPTLVKLANSSSGLITYQELGRILKIEPINVGRVGKELRDWICRSRNIPDINVLIVGKESGLPGIGCFPELPKNASKEEVKRAFHAGLSRVRAYPGWDNLLQEFGFKGAKISIDSLHRKAISHRKDLRRREGLEEGDKHKALKRYIAQRPHVLGIDSFLKVQTERPFYSGDEADIVLKLGKGKWVVVEVKEGRNDGELVKGIYQLVKYRALLSAEEKSMDKKADVSAFLVAFHIPAYITTLADKHNICTKVVPKADVI